MSVLVQRRSCGDALADRRLALALGYLADGDARAAADLAAQALERAPTFAPAHALLGRALAALGDPAGAVAALERALALEPDDALGVSLDLARLGALPEEDAILPGYVRALFDGYAERFEAHLTGPLAYRGPQVLAALLERVAPGRRFRSAVDLGCGTGLMGAAARARADRLVGVDIAPAMVEKARARGVYDALEAAEIADWLAEAPPASLDLALAADVLVYVGDPVHVFAGAARALAPGGLFLLTAQATEGTSFRLGADSRIAHSEPFLRARAEAAGLSVLALEPDWARREGGRPVPGFALALAR